MLKKKQASSSVNMIMVVIVLMLVSRLMGLVRDMMIMSSFGAGGMTDAYLTSVLLTTGLFLGIGSALASNTIPLVVKYRERDDSPVPDLLGAVLIGALGLVAVYWLVSPMVIESYTRNLDLTSEQLSMIPKMMGVLMPAIFFVIVTYFFIAVLQGHEHFALAAMVSIPFNILYFVYLSGFHRSFGLMGLAVVTSLGWLTQCLFVVTPSIRYKLIRLRLDFKGKGPLFKSFFIGLMPIAVVTLTHQMNIMIDFNSAGAFGEGSSTAVNYGNVLFKAIVTTTVYGITAVMFPKFNHKFIEEDRKGLYQSVVNVLRSIVLLLVPMSVGLIVLGDHIIVFMVQRGAFTAEASVATVTAFKGYSSFMIAFGVLEVLNKAYYTMNNRRTPLMMTAVVTVLNFVFSSILTGTFGYAGVSVGTSFAYYSGAIISLILFLKQDSSGGPKRLASTFWRSAVAAMVMGLAVSAFIRLAGLSSITSLVDLAVMGVAILVGVVVYGVMLLVVREELVTFNFKKLLK